MVDGGGGGRQRWPAVEASGGRWWLPVAGGAGRRCRWSLVVLGPGCYRGFPVMTEDPWSRPRFLDGWPREAGRDLDLTEGSR